MDWMAGLAHELLATLVTNSRVDTTGRDIKPFEIPPQRSYPTGETASPKQKEGGPDLQCLITCTALILATEPRLR